MDPGWRERRGSFGEVAELYDRRRPSYPDAVFDDLVRWSGIDPGSRVLEVGAGTGKATVSLAARGLRVVALEPDRRMVEVLRANTDGQDVVIEPSTFEQHEAPAGAYDLVAAAQAWHWVDRDVGLEKAADLLGPAGWIALFWLTPVDRGGAAADELDRVYDRLAPGLDTQWARRPGALSPSRWREELDASPRFGEVEDAEHPWTCTYTEREYVDLLRTHSTHRSLEGDHRQRLLDAVAKVVERHGGEIVVAYRCQLHAAPVLDV